MATALKGFVADMLPRSAPETANRTKRLLDRIAASDDFAEGIAGFREKRPPTFKGG